MHVNNTLKYQNQRKSFESFIICRPVVNYRPVVISRPVIIFRPVIMKIFSCVKRLFLWLLYFQVEFSSYSFLRCCLVKSFYLCSVYSFYILFSLEFFLCSLIVAVLCWNSDTELQNMKFSILYLMPNIDNEIVFQCHLVFWWI